MATRSPEPIRNPQSAIHNVASPRGIPLFLLLGLLPGLGALTARLLLGYDDNWGTTQNPLIVHGFGYFWQQLALPFGVQERVGFETGHWAPLSYLSLALDHAIFGAGSGHTLPEDFTPWGFRLVNGFLHGLCGWFVLRLGLKLTDSSRERRDPSPPAPLPEGERGEVAALFAALVFLFHPTVCETVCWIIERNNIVPALFGLWALDVYVGSYRTSEPSWRRTGCAALLLLLSQLGKASGVSWWPVMVAWDALLLRPNDWRRASARAAVLLTPVVLSVAVLLRSHADVLMPPLGQPPFGPWLMSAYLLLRYAALLLWPVHLSAFYHVSPDGVPFGDWQLWATLFAVVAIILLARKIDIPCARLALYGIWIAAAVAPIINPFVNTSFLLQDRYLYPALPAFGFLIAEFVFAGLPRLNPSPPTPLPTAARGEGPVILAGGLALLLLLASVARSYVWQNEETVFRDAVHAQPDSAFGHAYLANHLFQSAAEVPNEQQREQRTDEALHEHVLAAQCDDFDRLQWPLHYLNEQASIRIHKRDIDGARRIFRQVWEGRAERVSERGAKLYAVRFLAADALENGHAAEGLAYIDNGLKLDSDDVTLLINRLHYWETGKRFVEIRAETQRLQMRTGFQARLQENPELHAEFERIEHAQ